ncbi:hypothetical protein CMUS01_11661 [Colletotrichum musicola]|uniref:Uncharacterized protein n=1 Tax=Colletotrichum musicola TaxID=2175873 RepID=A0A8H6JW93_9PEZI|nr:hypothetical protein CMUS01_11661 [Colletotrichum musicola]
MPTTRSLESWVVPIGATAPGNFGFSLTNPWRPLEMAVSSMSSHFGPPPVHMGLFRRSRPPLPAPPRRTPKTPQRRRPDFKPRASCRESQAPKIPSPACDDRPLLALFQAGDADKLWPQWHLVL